ncbi:unnamed protein product [Didymodactylos carnosus]|uniref:Uncharacterized protein n=1 Tax=Didymodactylos carnosus TaxID=1234261 RepID=A0A814F6R4_9BILA|nr:unnamed protein product [Didymodactylos carnosus]CAF0975816.1 unnamed protein product [Didymodactylos carnosus]CAF3737056.1 unnamed protein product [Didymodactylos carnosus]CAF3748675.1 unnamed protein product [Didymodactylos carnosus]
MISLLSVYIRHLDLSIKSDTVSTDEWLHFHADRIVSLRINDIQLNDRLLSIFVILSRIELQSVWSQDIFTLSQLKSQPLCFSFPKLNESETHDHLLASVWHRDSHIKDLSIAYCFTFKAHHFSPSSSLTPSQHLIRLSLVISHIVLAIDLMPFIPVVEHLEIRLCDRHNHAGIYRPLHEEIFQACTWPSRVKVLRLLAYNQITNTYNVCSFIRGFSSSLENLSLYFTTTSSYLLSSWRNFERFLLNYLPHIKRLDFCVHSRAHETPARRTFDRWREKQHVVSIYHEEHLMHTRFTFPFVFDSLEHVTDDFVDFHSNINRADFLFSLPTVINISFRSREKLSLNLFKFIRHVCPYLRQITFKDFCQLNDDLIEDSRLTIPTLVQLCLDDVYYNSCNDSLRRLLHLAPNLEHLIIPVKFIRLMSMIENDVGQFTSIRRLTIIEHCCEGAVIDYSFCSDKSEKTMRNIFPNADITYQIKGDNY